MAAFKSRLNNLNVTAESLYTQEIIPEGHLIISDSNGFAQDGGLKSKVLAVSDGDDINSVGTSYQSLYNLVIPASLFTKVGQRIEFDFYGRVINTSNITNIITVWCESDPTAGSTINNLYDIPSNAQSRSFYVKGSVTYIGAYDGNDFAFKMSGIGEVVVNSGTPAYGNSIKYINYNNIEGYEETLPDKMLSFMCTGTGTWSVRLEDFSIKFIDS